jgi:hypothetical protein
MQDISLSCKTNGVINSTALRFAVTADDSSTSEQMPRFQQSDSSLPSLHSVIQLLSRASSTQSQPWYNQSCKHHPPVYAQTLLNFYGCYKYHPSRRWFIHLNYIRVRLNILQLVLRNFLRPYISSILLLQPYKRRIKSHLPFAGIIRSSPYSTR